MAYKRLQQAYIRDQLNQVQRDVSLFTLQNVDVEKYPDYVDQLTDLLIGAKSSSTTHAQTAAQRAKYILDNAQELYEQAVKRFNED